jgi:rubrerythrin
MARKRRRKSPAARPASPVPPDSGRPPDVPIWLCPNCGQSYFGAHPPDLCDYCRDFTTWRRVKPVG